MAATVPATHAHPISAVLMDRRDRPGEDALILLREAHPLPPQTNSGLFADFS
jgi:hypothetical protein